MDGQTKLVKYMSIEIMKDGAHVTQRESPGIPRVFVDYNMRNQVVSTLVSFVMSN
jgi:hypothetical protein